MKHFLICLICAFLLPVFASAQEDLQQEGASPYNGSPIVYIAGEESQNTPPAFKPIPFTFSGDVAIQTPFGKKTAAAFIPQTTDFNTIVKILGTGDIVVEEYIQLMNTSKQTLFTRVWPKITGANLTLIDVQKDGKPAQLSFSSKDTLWKAQETEPLSEGIHNFKITYLLKDALIQKDKSTHLKLSITGPDWSLPIERFSVVVLFPQKAALTRQDISFGSNELMIPEAVKIQVDSKGNILYTLTRPLPALADVRLNIEFDSTLLTKPALIDRAFENMNHTLFWLCSLALLLYTGITLFYLKHKKTGAVLKELSGYTLPALHFIATCKTDTAFLKQVATFYTWQKKKHRALSLLIKIKNRFPKIGYGILKSWIWINILRKYILTMGLMIALVTIQAANVNMALSGSAIGFLALLTVCLLIVIYVKGEKPYIARELWAVERLISNKNIGFGLSSTSLQALFVQFYLYSLAMEQEKSWINALKPYKIDLTSFTFIKR